MAVRRLFGYPVGMEAKLAELQRMADRAENRRIVQQAEWHMRREREVALIHLCQWAGFGGNAMWMDEHGPFALTHRIP